jgi:hypothetical protein
VKTLRQRAATKLRQDRMWGAKYYSELRRAEQKMEHARFVGTPAGYTLDDPKVLKSNTAYRIFRDVQIPEAMKIQIWGETEPLIVSDSEDA